MGFLEIGALLFGIFLPSCGTGLCAFSGCVAYDGLSLADHRAFVTSTGQNGNFGGLSGADAICQARANAAGLGRTYKAILGDSTADASSRLSFSGSVYIFTSATDSEKVVENGADLWNPPNNLLRSIAFDENANVISSGSARTGSENNGIAAANHCNNWSSSNAGDFGQVGAITHTGGTYLALATASCSATGPRLYCVSQ